MGVIGILHLSLAMLLHVAFVSYAVVTSFSSPLAYLIFLYWVCFCFLFFLSLLWIRCKGWGVGSQDTQPPLLCLLLLLILLLGDDDDYYYYHYDDDDFIMTMSLLLGCFCRCCSLCPSSFYYSCSCCSSWWYYVIVFLPQGVLPFDSDAFVNNVFILSSSNGHRGQNWQQNKINNKSTATRYYSTSA